MMALFLYAASLLVLFYTYFGYPALIAILAWLTPNWTRPNNSFTPRVSVIIPVHNGEKYIENKLRSLFDLAYPADKLEILLFSDGSTDETEAVLHASAENDSRIRVFSSALRRGKPYAINFLRHQAKGEVLLMTDIRQPISSTALRDLVAHLADPVVGCASGELVLHGSASTSLYWAYERWIRKYESRFRSTVGVTGAIYVIRKKDLSDVPEEILLDDMWIPMVLRLKRQRILFVPGAIAYDEAFADERELKRKIRTLAGNYQLFAKMPRLLVPFLNPSWFETVSHKLLRLFCPWLLLVLLGSSITLAISADALPPTLIWSARILVASQLLFYLAAALGHRAGPLAGIARTFVVMNFAAVVGLWRFIRGGIMIAW